MLTMNHENNRSLVNGSRGVVKGFVHKDVIEENLKKDVDKMREAERVRCIYMYKYICVCVCMFIMCVCMYCTYTCM